MKYIKMKPADRRKVLKAQSIFDAEKRKRKYNPKYEQPTEFILNEIDILETTKIEPEVPKKTYRRRKVKVDKVKVDKVKVDGVKVNDDI